MIQVRKFLRLAVLPLGLAGMLGLTGCSGINGSYGVSPASFFLPGLLKVEPEPPVLPTESDPLPVLVAVHTPVK